MIVAADGSERMPRTFRAGYVAPQVWSDTGELILTSLSNGNDIVATPITPTGEVRDVVASASAEYDPALSPNGHWLAYVSDRTGRPEIWVQGYPDGIPVRVSRAAERQVTTLWHRVA
jgi:Tol biopolymer transport system component